jgi:hypothetical protein
MGGGPAWALGSDLEFSAPAGRFHFWIPAPLRKVYITETYTMRFFRPRLPTTRLKFLPTWDVFIHCTHSGDGRTLQCPLLLCDTTHSGDRDSHRGRCAEIAITAACAPAGSRNRGRDSGVAGGMALTRYLEKMLFGVTAADPGTFIVVAAVFILVTLVASYLPAERATRVDPLAALRYE